MPGSSAVTDRWIRRLTRGTPDGHRQTGYRYRYKGMGLLDNDLTETQGVDGTNLAALEGGTPEDAQITSAAVRLTLDPCQRQLS